MILTGENILLISSILLFASIIASKTSFRLGIPTLLLFIMLGMMAGSDGFGGIYFNDPKMAQIIGVIGLNFILFSGGLETNWKDVKPVVGRGILLSTVGVFTTALLLGIFIHWVTHLSLYEGLLLGAIVSSTDAAAVFSILRTRKTGLKGKLRPTLELESGSNDPMAYILTITMIQLLQFPDISGWQLLWSLVLQMVLGGVMGWFMGKMMIVVINKIRLEVDGLYPVLLLALMFFTFSFTDLLGGNGFLAVYLSAIILGNHEFVHKKSLILFYDGQAWLMQIVLFLTLGLLVFPSQLLPLTGLGLLVAGFLMFVARPVSVMLCLAFFRMKMRNRLFISWVGLRGAVPIVFATYPLMAGLENAQFIFNLVFFISISSVLFQGTTLSLVARWLHVAVPADVKRKSAFERSLEQRLLKSHFEYTISEGSRGEGRKILQLGLPASAFITMVFRGGEYFIPEGNTRLQAGDKLIMLADSEDDMKAVFDVLQ